MNLRRFTALGIAQYRAFLDAFQTEKRLPYPKDILCDAAFSELVEGEVALEPREFATRYDLASYLNEKFEAVEFQPSPADSGMWAWISFFYFDAICPTSRGGEQEPGSSPRWIPESTDWRRYYRHLVAGPYGIFRAHRENPGRAMALLCQKPGRPGDVVEQLASRQQRVTSAAIMQVATDCFVDPKTGGLRRSASSKGAGSARRYIAVLDQFDVTWDLAMLSPERLRSMLPQEFRGLLSGNE